MNALNRVLTNEHRKCAEKIGSDQQHVMTTVCKNSDITNVFFLTECLCNCKSVRTLASA